MKIITNSTFGFVNSAKQKDMYVDMPIYFLFFFSLAFIIYEAQLRRELFWMTKGSCFIEQLPIPLNLS